MILTIIIFGIIFLSFLMMSVFLLKGKGAFLIAGYNTMSKQEKEKYDENALCRSIGSMMLIVSFCILTLFLGLFFDIEWLFYCGFILAIIVPIGWMIILNRGKIFIKNESLMTPSSCEAQLPETSNLPKQNISAITTITVFILIGVCFLFYFGVKEPVVNIHENSLQIKAMYGRTIKFSEIENIVLIEKSMREIGTGRRVNGFGGIGQTLKGNFLSKDHGEILLFVQSKSSPTIRIKRKPGKDIYLSFKNREKTQELYILLRNAVIVQ